jgi:15-cis-phytoene synthase/lycopene beta-cyclase
LQIAVVSTTPWDSYLIRSRIWTYPPDAIIGPTLFQIPIEEFFFFIIQTYNTSLLYLLLSKATFHPVYLRAERKVSHSRGPINEKWRYYKLGGQLFLALIWRGAITLNKNGKNGTYMALIIGWAAPILLLLWYVVLSPTIGRKADRSRTFAYQFLIGLPWTNTVLPIALPTLYLWMVDTLALQRGTWVIESGTKLGIQLWPGLEIEEAVFFLVTNALIVFGLVAFDTALAILNTFSSFTWKLPVWPSPVLLVRALLKSKAEYNEQRIAGLKEAVDRLKNKSRSFYLASGAFEGKLRIHLIILYSFCRVADDLVDDASSLEEAKEWIAKLKEFLDRSYGDTEEKDSIFGFTEENFGKKAHSALLMLPTPYLSKEPLYDLLRGFDMDLAFSKSAESTFPIKTEEDLELYGARVAGTVAQLCLELVYAHLPNQTSEIARKRLIQAGATMGIALQYVNISRDIAVDAEMGRVYIPTAWLKEESLTPEDIIKAPSGPKIDTLRVRLLEKAFKTYSEVRGAIEELPHQARGPMRVAVESYMEIGRVLKEGKYPLKRGRATVPKLRRLIVAWNALQGS